MTEQAQGDIQEDNDIARVTRWSFAAGAETGFHRHDYDYVVVPLASGRLKIVDKEGKESLSELTAGVSYFRRAGVEHNVINASGSDFAFVEVEFKARFT
ncbi:cupin domain-containing protein [Pelagibius sp. CAU 1746]|uniref:cupin domain-containing protein n=1 Tax=Pelagibius sp. CAU 1746 TaxID=3140370 RepID=UPI00325BC793